MALLVGCGVQTIIFPSPSHRIDIIIYSVDVVGAWQLCKSGNWFIHLRPRIIPNDSLNEWRRFDDPWPIRCPRPINWDKRMNRYSTVYSNLAESISARLMWRFVNAGASGKGFWVVPLFLQCPTINSMVLWAGVFQSVNLIVFPISCCGDVLLGQFLPSRRLVFFSLGDCGAVLWAMNIKQDLNINEELVAFSGR